MKCWHGIEGAGVILHVKIVKFDVDLVIGNIIENSFFPKTIILCTDMNKPRSHIQRSKLKPPEMMNLEYQDGGQSAFPIHKQTSLF